MSRSRGEATDEGRARGRKRAETWLGSEVWGYPAVTWDDELGIPVPVTKGPDTQLCSGMNRSTWTPCAWSAGAGTVHPGVGNCVRHDTPVMKATGAWMMAHVIARQLDISPWEALLLPIRRAAAWADFYETKMGEAPDDDAVAPGGTHHHWVVSAERVNDKLAKYAKMAVDAGVAAMLVQQARNEGAQIAQVLNAAIGAIDLTEEQEARLRAALRQALLAIDTPSTIEGEVADEPGLHGSTTVDT